MQGARVVLAMTVAALALQANGAGATGPTPPTDPVGTVSSEPPGTLARENQAAAEDALIVLDDFPVGWTEEVEEELTDQDRAYQQQVAECADGTGDDLLDLGGPAARSADFVGPDDQRVEQTVTIVDQAVAEDFMVRFAAPGVDRCFRDAVEVFVTENFASPEDPSQTLPGDVSVDEVTVAEVLVEPAGDELVGYRVTLAMTISGVPVEAFVDIVAVRSGGSLTGLTFQSLFEPFPADEVGHYTALAAERLPG